MCTKGWEEEEGKSEAKDLRTRNLAIIAETINDDYLFPRSLSVKMKRERERIQTDSTHMKIFHRKKEKRNLSILK